MNITILLTYLLKISLNHVMVLDLSIFLEKHQETSGFLMFSGDIEQNQCNEMG